MSNHQIAFLVFKVGVFLVSVMCIVWLFVTRDNQDDEPVFDHWDMELIEFVKNGEWWHGDGDYLVLCFSCCPSCPLARDYDKAQRPITVIATNDARSNGRGRFMPRLRKAVADSSVCRSEDAPRFFADAVVRVRDGEFSVSWYTPLYNHDAIYEYLRIY